MAPSLIGAIGQCARLQSLRLKFLCVEAGAFARLCCTTAPRQLRHLSLEHCQIPAPQADECGSPISTLVGLESLHLNRVLGVDRLLPQLAHAPALRTLVIPCEADQPDAVASLGATHPSRDALL